MVFREEYDTLDLLYEIRYVLNFTMEILIFIIMCELDLLGKSKLKINVQSYSFREPFAFFNLIIKN